MTIPTPLWPSRSHARIGPLCRFKCSESNNSYLQSRAALWSFTVIPVDLRPLFVRALLQILKQFNGIFRSQVFINPFTIDLEHGGVGTGTQTFDFLDGEHVVGSGLATLDAEVFLAGLDNLLGAPELAGRGSADLEVEFAHPLPVEHGVKSGHLVDIHFVDFGDFRYFPHGTERQEVIVLFLGHVQEWDDC